MAFANSAHTSTVVSNNHTGTNPLAGTRRTYMCERLQEKVLAKSPKHIKSRTSSLARSYKMGNEGHLALIKGIKLMSKAPETTFPSHLHLKRKKALLSK